MKFDTLEWLIKKICAAYNKKFISFQIELKKDGFDNHIGYLYRLSYSYKKGDLRSKEEYTNTIFKRNAIKNIIFDIQEHFLKEFYNKFIVKCRDCDNLVFSEDKDASNRLCWFCWGCEEDEL